MALNPSQAQTAQLIYTLAKQRGLPDQRARELVAASYAESGLNPSARNKSSGAAGLFQLLSSGYVNRANATGGVNDPRANTNAILPDYVNYWRSHPNAAPGEAAAAVERSGQPGSFYAAPLAKIGALGAARSPGVDSLTSLGLSSSAAQPAAGTDPSLRRAFAMQLIQANQAGGHGRTVDYSPVMQALTALRQQPAGDSGATFDSQPMNAASPSVAGAGRGSAIAKTALTQLGTPYQWGGPAKLGGRTDCSGLLQASAAANGVKIARTTYDQFKQGQSVPLDQLQPGDAVFSHPTAQGPGHVSIYIGNGKLVEDPHTGAVVSISDLHGRKGIVGARRYV